VKSFVLPAPAPLEGSRGTPWIMRLVAFRVAGLVVRLEEVRRLAGDAACVAFLS